MDTGTWVRRRWLDRRAARWYRGDAITGTAESVGAETIAPISGRSCLVFEIAVEVEQDARWQLVGRVMTPSLFRIRSQAGTKLVDSDSMNCAFGNYRAGTAAVEPAVIGNVIAHAGLSFFYWRSTAPMLFWDGVRARRARAHEWTLLSGDRVTLIPRIRIISNCFSSKT